MSLSNSPLLQHWHLLERIEPKFKTWFWNTITATNPRTNPASIPPVHCAPFRVRWSPWSAWIFSLLVMKGLSLRPFISCLGSILSNRRAAFPYLATRFDWGFLSSFTWLETFGIGRYDVDAQRRNWVCVGLRVSCSWRESRSSVAWSSMGILQTLINSTDLLPMNIVRAPPLISLESWAKHSVNR